MTDLTAGVDAKAIWLRGTERDNNGEKDIYAFYTTSVFVDQVNGANDAYESDEKGSTIDFEYFLRVARENLSAAFPLRFSVPLKTGTHFRLLRRPIPTTAICAPGINMS